MSRLTHRSPNPITPPPAQRRASNSFSLWAWLLLPLFPAAILCAQSTGQFPSVPEPHLQPRLGLVFQAQTFQSQIPSEQETGSQTNAPSPVPQSDPAQNSSQPASVDSGSSELDTVFPHTVTGRYWVSGQVNVILQGHPYFQAQYSGANSLSNLGQSATTHVMTLYTGYQFTKNTEVFADFEDATGNGIGNANGLAGYSNLDSVRLVQGVALSKGPYLARAMIRQVVPLTDKRVNAERDELHLATSIAPRRLEFRAGKFDLTDFFDVNDWGSDSHLQFLNWTVDTDGAYDYAADTRGYTDGAMVEYDNYWWSARFAEALMPKTANGAYLDADVARSRSENFEWEARGSLFGHQPGVVRLLGYLNHADMGNYDQAIADYLDHETTTPDIIATRQYGRHRYGFGLNFQQSLTEQTGIFGRLGWSDGHNESFCYTEDDQTAELGGFSIGRAWHRPSDRAGAAFVANGIVAAHQQYLALGGLGFILGDGALTYGPEKIVESFYTAHLWRGFFVSYDFQHVNDPGYNRARGPVAISAVRFHTDF